MEPQEYQSRVLAMVRESLNKPKQEKAPITYAGPSPYDAEIAELLGRTPKGEIGQRFIMLCHWREGYIRAKAEDAEVLEAALAHIAELHQTKEALFACETADRIRAALSQKEG